MKHTSHFHETYHSLSMLYFISTCFRPLTVQGFSDPISQLTDNAFRSQDWWYFAKAGMLPQTTRPRNSLAD